MTERHQRSQLIHPSASAEEAGAIVAALERFRRATARPPAAGPAARHEWSLAAILEGVSHQGQGDARDPWINT
jgi:hypothetical protein